MKKSLIVNAKLLYNVKFGCAKHEHMVKYSTVVWSVVTIDSRFIVQVKN